LTDWLGGGILEKKISNKLLTLSFEKEQIAHSSSYNNKLIFL